MVRAVTVNKMRFCLQSTDTAQYIKPRCLTEISKRAFSYASPLAWNDLPPSLHCKTDSKRFRKHIKTHYFNRTFIGILQCMSGQLSKTGNITISIIIIITISKTNIAKLQRMQNNLARVVCKSPYNTNVTKLLRELHWLSVRHRITYKVASITYHTRNCQQPGSLLDSLI